jgi:hypothetical protein
MTNSNLRVKLEEWMFSWNVQCIWELHYLINYQIMLGTWKIISFSIGADILPTMPYRVIYLIILINRRWLLSKEGPWIVIILLICELCFCSLFKQQKIMFKTMLSGPLVTKAWGVPRLLMVDEMTYSYWEGRVFTFGCCILLHIYITGSLWGRQSQQSFNTINGIIKNQLEREEVSYKDVA